MAESILLIDDEETLRESLGRLMTREGYDVTTTGSGEDALELYSATAYDLVISDIILPGIDGIEVLRKVKEKNPEQLVIIITAYASLETAVEALRAGAHDYIMKPIIHEEIKHLVKNAFRQRSLGAGNRILQKQIEKEYDFSHIIGDNPGIKRILEEVAKIADSRSNVLLFGETGTGKELFARAIHHNSNRREKPFVPINCSAIPDNLLESELFGHVKGAFTGAAGAKKGLFEEAVGGTVFLDEIGEMSTALQSKLLRVIEDREVRPVGGNQSVKVDLRFIAATNKDLTRAISDGSFREDLFYRINTISLTLVPLRDRPEDLPRLSAYFLDKFSAELGKPVRRISEDTFSVFRDYNWPGNVRELKNIIERAVLVADSDTISPEHLPDAIRGERTIVSESAMKGLSIEDYTKAAILMYQETLSEQKIADMLGITRKSLWEKRKRWGIPKG
ncbi:MAG: sigma-54-dependent Fis family transcriptional regulator [Nitrospirae bacterium]|nr:sigma-54-dependent Fis family transcriptional regulator [Nitrospirota bacterium]